MDPNAPGPEPGVPSPWGAPPPDPFGAPPPPYGTPPATDPYGAPPPPAYGTPPPPPPPYGAPPPYGSPTPYGAPPPGWGAAAPTKSAGSGIVRKLLIVVLGVVAVIIVLGILGMVVLGQDAGKVQFSATAYDQSNATCHMDNPITTASTNGSFYMIAALRDTLEGGQQFTLTVTKDGQSYGQPLTSSLPSKFNCYIEQNPMSLTDPGVYKFTFTLDGKIESEGTLIVK